MTYADPPLILFHVSYLFQMYLHMGGQTDSLWLWCHSTKKHCKKGGYLFAVPNSSLQGAGDQRVKFLDTPFKSNEWWNPCKWTYFPKFWLKTTELVVASSLRMCRAWFSHPALYFCCRLRPDFPLLMFSHFSPNFRHFEVVDCLIRRSIFCEFLSCRSLRAVQKISCKGHGLARIYP